MFVIMKDNFMSGWGKAKDITNLYEVECDDLDQVEMIERNANNRTDMSNVKYKVKETKDYYGVLITRVHFDDLGGVWKK